MTKEKQSHKKNPCIGKKVHEIVYAPRRPLPVFTKIHDIIMYGIFNPQNHEETPHS